MQVHVLLRAMGNHPDSAWSAGVEPAQTHEWPCLPHFPVPGPGATPCRTTLLCYACSVPMKPSAHSGPSASLPCTCRDCAGRCKERSMCRWGPPASTSSLAARTLSCLCRRKSNCTFTLRSVHAAAGHEA